MNQGRIWCVVSPNVGLPLLLGSVAVTSLIVHACVMSHTTWMSNYWQGNSRAKTAEIESPSSVASASPTAGSAYVLSIAPMAGAPGKAETSFVVTVVANPAVTQSADATPGGGAVMMASAVPK